MSDTVDANDSELDSPDLADREVEDDQELDALIEEQAEDEGWDAQNPQTRSSRKGGAENAPTR